MHTCLPSPNCYIPGTASFSRSHHSSSPGSVSPNSFHYMDVPHQRIPSSDPIPAPRSEAAAPPDTGIERRVSPTFHPQPSYSRPSRDISSQLPSGNLPPVPRFNPSAMGLAYCKDLTPLLSEEEQENLVSLDKLKHFLATAPNRWTSSGQPDDLTEDVLSDVSQMYASHPSMNRFLLPSSEYVTCVLWSGLYYITGTDIVRALVFRFEAFGRPIRNMKKFEEGIFSDLRNLKPGIDAILEEPKSPFLDLLFKYQCIRTQKKQKVFYWYSVPHDRLFLDALERDIKRENMGLEPTTVVVGEPALSFTYEPQRSLYEQFGRTTRSRERGIPAETTSLAADSQSMANGNASVSAASQSSQSSADMTRIDGTGIGQPHPTLQRNHMPFMPFSIFEGSPSYKQRRKKPTTHFLPGNPDPVTRSNSDESHHSHESSIDANVGYCAGERGMTAADMFIAQARGDLIRSQKEGVHQRNDGSAVPRIPPAGFVARLTPCLSPIPANRRTHSYEEVASDDSAHRLSHAYLPANHDDTTLTSFSPGDVSSAVLHKPATTNTFVCPLFSCGRLYNRQEHLKRHLRTHSVEQPYQRDRCMKRFSRSDNLNQHLRLHARVDANDANSGELGTYEMDAESDGTDESDNSFTLSFPNGLQNLDMCELAVAGPVREILGDEEGLVTGRGLMHRPESNDISDTNYPYYSPSFPSTADTEGNFSQLDFFPSVDASDMTWANLSPSPSTSDSLSLYNGEPIIPSLSGPSYPPEFDEVSLHRSVITRGVPGSMRRHRSMTPSLLRSVDRGQSPSNRGYHPYASSNHSRPSSSSSSPSSRAHSLDSLATPPPPILDNLYTTQPHCISSVSQPQIDFNVPGQMSLYDGPLGMRQSCPTPFFDSHPLLSSA